MLDYNRIAYELDGLKAVPDDVEGLSMLQHFDYPEEWHYNGNAEFSDSAKFGKGCVYFPDATSSVSVTNTTGMFNLNPEANYEFEAFVKLAGTAADADILSLGGLALAQKRAEREVFDTTTNWAAQGYYFFGGHTFKYYSSAKTWSNAKTACENLGGHLATSTSAEKNTFLFSLISTNTWLGATDEASEGTWKWVTGETWSYTNWASGQPDNSSKKEHYLEFNLGFGNRVWNDISATTTQGYICEWDYDIRNTTEEYSVLGLTSTDWGIDAATITELTANVWHHLLLRISGQYVTLYVDGTQALSETITGTDTLTPEAVTLGGYVGYMDEFAFRRNAGSGVPTVPTTAYGAEIVPVEVPATTTNNAPVSRAAWSCENLPDGLTLSSAGVLSGHPTTAGTYECEFSVATNWGTTTKTVRIVVA